MKQKTKNILKISGAVVATTGLAALSAYTTARFLVKVALDRDEPKKMKKSTKKISGSSPNNDYHEALKIGSQVLREKESQKVEIISHDGTPLVGHYIPAKDPKRLIIAMHGWRSSWARDFGLIADFWNENNCSVLYVEQRGQNESGGNYMGFGLIERYDCLDWILWVNDNIGTYLPIYLVGVSMGAATVLMATGLSLPDNVHGVIADCGFTSPYDIWKHVANNNLHMSFGFKGTLANMICKGKINLNADDYSTLDAMKICKVPIMFIHGTDDRFVPIEMTYKNYKACASPKRIFVVPGAGHAMSYFVNSEGYEKACKDFWQDYDI